MACHQGCRKVKLSNIQGDFVLHDRAVNNLRTRLCMA
jgi:hypothetical protein